MGGRLKVEGCFECDWAFYFVRKWVFVVNGYSVV